VFVSGLLPLSLSGEKLAMKKFLVAAVFSLAALLLLAQEHDHNQAQQMPSGQGELNATRPQP
jgi:uncharacterized protein YdeI (BOF family)